MILTPFQGTDIADVDRLSQFFKSIGFARMQVATDAEHDQMIAYTSQLDVYKRQQLPLMVRKYRQRK